MCCHKCFSVSGKRLSVQQRLYLCRQAGKRENEQSAALPAVRRRICFFVGPVSLHCGRMYFENELAWVDFKRADRWCADLCDCFFRQGARKKVRRKSPTVFPFPLNGPAGGLSPFPLPLRLVTFLLFLVAIPIKRTVDLMLSTVRPPGGIASAGPLLFFLSEITRCPEPSWRRPP